MLDDYSEVGNGLQFAGKQEVDKIACAVDAFPEAYEKAVAWGADMLIVHHGITKGAKADQVYDDLLVRKLEPLFEHKLNVYGCHLPLDGHPIYGNNIQLLHALGLKKEGSWALYDGKQLGFYGLAAKSDGTVYTLAEFVQHTESIINHTCQVLPYGPDSVGRVGILTGGGMGALLETPEYQVDTLITGEIAYAGMFWAMERNVNVILGGHYKTETLGVQALCKQIEAKFDIPWTFLDFNFKL